MLGLRHAREVDLRVRPVQLELLHEAGDTLEEHVVAEVDDERIVGDELPREPDRVGDARRPVLMEICDGKSPRVAVSDGVLHLRRGGADHDADLLDARVADRLERGEQDRLVRDRDQLFGVRVRDGAESGTLPPG